jgi:cytidylate kinase
VLITEEELIHYGTPRKSGRYPWGSGGDEETPPRNPEFLDHVEGLKSQGMSEAEIANGMSMTVGQLRIEKSLAKSAKKQADIDFANRLKEKGTSTSAIAERMGIPESTARSLLAPGAADKAKVLTTTSTMLKDQVKEKTYVDVGAGVESQLGISRTKLDTSIGQLKAEGYVVHTVKSPQVSGHDTTYKVLCPPGTTQKDVFLNRDKIQQIKSFSKDGGRGRYGLHEPIKINPKRIQVVYGEDGGGKADGMIYVRPGIDDISLGGAHYAQVRIAVGDSKYLKGMAMYKTDLPDGVDLQFNTNKRDTGNKLDAMKDIKDDKDNPFGSLIDHQIIADEHTDKERVTSAMNIVNETGDWDKWSRTLSSQMLSKQSPALAKSQLDMTYEHRQQQYEDIKALTNATVRKKLLEEFAEGTAAASVHLKAASLPGQAVHVILPLSKIEPTQIYAPNYQNGDTVVLIRHPHGGTFEIPQLTVNNKNAEGRKLLGNAKDAVGIHHSVAQHLSGADFDGDTVLVIPNNHQRITVTPALKELQNFDPVASYPAYPGMKPMKNTQTEMGKISNLVTDMTIKGASHEELAQAIRHSMVVIDAEKHNLDYKESYRANGIKKLKEKYQRQPNGSQGAATLISRARSEVRVPQRKDRTRALGGPVDPVTGERRYEDTNAINYRTGKPKTTITTKLAEATDAHTLSSGTRMETLYANHSNKLKDLSNQARLDAFNTPTSKRDPSAAKTYAKEVESLNSKLAIANRNKPLERQAQLIANTWTKAKRVEDPNMDKDTLKKIKYQHQEEARKRTGAKKKRIEVSTDEWDAIQAGAISGSKLNDILNNANMDIVREHATPRTEILMTSTKTNRAKAMLSSGYTRAEVARALGVSLTTLDTATK